MMHPASQRKEYCILLLNEATKAGSRIAPHRVAPPQSTRSRRNAASDDVSTSASKVLLECAHCQCRFWTKKQPQHADPLSPRAAVVSKASERNNLSPATSRVGREGVPRSSDSGNCSSSKRVLA